jgi:class 3 adenylate cyclase
MRIQAGFGKDRVMSDPSSRRKLAAILSADVVGYSRLMAANEAATVETFKSYRDIIARPGGATRRPRG